MALALLGAGTLSIGCRRYVVDDSLPGEADAPLYAVVDSSTFAPGEFAEFVYGAGSIFRADATRYVADAAKSLVLDNNMRLGRAMAVEAGNESAAWGYDRYVLGYTSVDQSGNPIQLSEVVIFPVGRGWTHKVGKLYLSSHVAIFSDDERPSSPLGGDVFSGTVSRDVAFISPDLQGYGISSDSFHPFLNHPLLARQSVDGVLAAIAFLSDRGVIVEGRYDLISGGYSQGAGNALAIHRFVQEECTVEQKEKIRLLKSLCADGAYSPTRSIEAYVNSTELSSPQLIPFVIEGMYYSFPEYMEGIGFEDFFTPEFLSSGVLTMLESKKFNVFELRQRIMATVGSDPRAILSADFYAAGSPLREGIRKAAAGCELTSGWAPLRQVVLYHSPDDTTVPFFNATDALEGLGKGDIQLIRLPSPSTGDEFPHILGGAYYFLGILLGGTLK